MWTSTDHFYACISCTTIMIGIFKPCPDNHHEQRVAREICYECVEAEKLRAEVA